MYVEMSDEEASNQATAAIKSLPKNKQKLFDHKVVADVIQKDHILDDFITYAKVMDAGKWSAEQYLNAIRYIGYLSMGYGKSKSFVFTFPEHSKTDSRTLSKFTNKYDTSSLVKEIRKIHIAQPYLRYHDVAEEALYVNVDLMRNARSEMVRHQSAKALMEYLKIPEDNHLTVDVNVKKDNSALELEHTLMKLAKGQLDLVESGKATNKQIAEMDIIEAQLDE